MDQVSESRLALVNPSLADKIRQLAVTLAAENEFVRVTQGLRTVEEQDALYAKGRTAPGPEVTKARGGQSFHNVGLAVDLVVDSALAPAGTFIPDWNVGHPVWKRMVEVGESLGMVSGSTFRSLPDYPHFQVTGRFPGDKPDQEMIDLYHTGGLTAVWDAVNSSL